MDDIDIGSTNIKEIERLKGYLHTQFKLKDLGNLKFFLELEIARSNARIMPCQCKFALDILEEHGLIGSKPTDIPIVPIHRLSRLDDYLLTNPTVY